MIFGRIEASALAEQAADRVVLDTFTVGAGILTKLSGLMDGGGATVGGQVGVGVAYTPGGKLFARSAEFVVPTGAEPGWVDAAFAAPVYFDGGPLQLGFHWGPASLSARLYGALGDGVVATDPYGDGTASTLPSAAAGLGPAAFATMASPHAWRDLPDELIAALPFASGQALLAGTPQITGRYTATCEWHGTVLGPAGAFALVNESGPLADLVGERVRISYRSRELFCYVWSTADMDEDLSLPRGHFLRLGSLSVDHRRVRVEVVV